MNKKRAILLSFLVGCLLIYLGVIGLVFNGCVTYPSAMMSPDDLPSYLGEVWPPPGGVTSKLCYSIELTSLLYPSIDKPTRGVGIGLITIEADDININTVDIETTEIINRTQLFIDNQIVITDTLIVYPGLSLVYYDELGTSHIYKNGAYGYFMTWMPELTLGYHEARVEILNNVGDVLEYSWNFFVLP